MHKTDQVNKYNKRILHINAGRRVYQLLLFAFVLSYFLQIFCDKSIHPCICLEKYFQIVSKNYV